MVLYRVLAAIGFVSVLALAAAGCAPVQVEPPQLHLDTSREMGPSVTNVKLENGAGKTLWSGAPGQDVTANPPLDDLDGKVTITRTYDDGATKKQTLTYEPHKPIKIGYSSAGNDYYIDTSAPPPTGSSGAGQPGTKSGLALKPTMPRFYISAQPSYTFFNRSDTPIIRKEDGGTILGYVKGDNDTSNPAFNGSVGFVLNEPFFGLGKKWGLELNGSYYKSSATTSIDSIPSNGGQLAFFGPLAGGGGVTGNDITNLRYKTDYWSWAVGPRLRKSYPLGTIAGVNVNMNSYLGFDYGEDEDDEDLSFDIPGSAVSVASMVKLDSRYYGPDFGFYSAWEICDNLHVTAGAFGKVYFNELQAKRMIDLTNGLNGADSIRETTFTAGGGANVGVNVKVAPNFTAKFGFGYERSGNSPFLDVNQETGEATVKAKSADIYRITVGAKMKF